MRAGTWTLPGNAWTAVVDEELDRCTTPVQALLLAMSGDHATAGRFVVVILRLGECEWRMLRLMLCREDEAGALELSACQVNDLHSHPGRLNCSAWARVDEKKNEASLRRK